MTIYHVPHLAMGGELAKSYTGRSAVMSYNNFFYWIGGAAMFKVNQLIFFATAGVAGNALLNESMKTRHWDKVQELIGVPIVRDDALKAQLGTVANDVDVVWIRGGEVRVERP